MRDIVIGCTKSGHLECSRIIECGLGRFLDRLHHNSGLENAASPLQHFDRHCSRQRLSAWACGRISIDRVFGWPEFTQHAVLQLDFRAAFTLSGLSYVAVFLFMDIFDTTGTLIGVSQQAGLMKDGRVPRVREAMLADSVGTVAGACVGTSTVTSYIESVAGVEQGGRTGLTALTTAVLFLVAIGFSPLIVSLGAYSPVTSPALVVVGAMMFRAVRSKLNGQTKQKQFQHFLLNSGDTDLFFHC